MTAIITSPQWTWGILRLLFQIGDNRIHCLVNINMGSIFPWTNRKRQETLGIIPWGISRQRRFNLKENNFNLNVPNKGGARMLQIDLKPQLHSILTIQSHLSGKVCRALTKTCSLMWKNSCIIWGCKMPNWDLISHVCSLKWIECNIKSKKCKCILGN